MKKESDFQSRLIGKIEKLFPGCIVEKHDPYRNGFPDLIILYKDRWAMLECKRETNASKRPLQEHYVDILNQMSFCAFVYPENEQEVLDGLQSAFEPERNARVPGSK
jgi:hypothetical protein